MPYVYDPDSAVVTDSQVPIDDEFGITQDLDGLLVSEHAYKPTRAEKEKFDHHDADVAAIFTRPRMDLDVTGEVTLLASPFVAHPAAPIDRNLVTNWYPGLNFGFPTSRGYFRYGQPDFTSKPGDLYALKVTLRLIFRPLTAFHKIIAPANAA